MKNLTVLGLCLGLAMALSFAPAQASDSAEGKAKGHDMQIKIDKKTGKKISGDDDSVEVAKMSAADSTVVSAAASGIMPLDSSTERLNADGSVSAKLGLRQMKFVTMSIDENGNREVQHETLESFEATTQESTASTEEE
jgi:hypothetical protein